MDLTKLLVFLLSFSGCAKERATPTPLGSSLAGETRVGKGDIEHIIVVDGNLYSPSSRSISVQRIRWYWDYKVSWTAEEGSMVKATDVVIRLDQSALQKDLSEREVALEETKLNLEEETIRANDDIADAKSAITLAEFDLKREKLLLTDSDAVSEAEKQKQKLKVAGAEAALRRAREKVTATKDRMDRKLEMQRLKVKQAQDEVTAMKEGLAKTELKAPQDGLLIFPLYSTNAGWQKARPGGVVTVNTQIAEIANTKDLVARLFVPEVDADGVVSDTPGEVTLSIAPGKSFSGRVKSVSQVPTTQTERTGSKSSKPADNIRQFEVLFEIDGLPAEAMPGMTVRAILTPIRKQAVLLVPIEALAITPPVGDAAPQPAFENRGATTADAYVLTRAKASDNYRWQKVKLGIQSLTQAEVLEGVQEGDSVKLFAW